MPFGLLFPSLPWTTIDILVKVVGLLGATLVIYAILLETEKRQDAVFVIGSAALLVYSLIFGSAVFTYLSAGILLLSGHKLIQILRGRHHHSKELIEEFKHPEK